MKLCFSNLELTIIYAIYAVYLEIIFYANNSFPFMDVTYCTCESYLTEFEGFNQNEILRRLNKVITRRFNKRVHVKGNTTKLDER